MIVAATLRAAAEYRALLYLCPSCQSGGELSEKHCKCFKVCFVFVIQKRSIKTVYTMIQTLKHRRYASRSLDIPLGL